MTMDNKKAASDDLLNELESIRHLLSDDTTPSNAADKSDSQNARRIPVLIPDDNIPTLKPERHHQEGRTHRTHKNQASSHDKNLPATSLLLSSTRSREKIIDDVVRHAMPRLEAILRELVQEALLQEKLRGGKR